MRSRQLGVWSALLMVASALGVPGAMPVNAAPTAPDAPAGLDDSWRDGVRSTADDGPVVAEPAPTGRLAPSLQRLTRTEGSAVVTVEIAGNDAAIANAVREAGGSMGRGGGGLYLATVPADRLAGLAGAAGIARVNPPTGPALRPSAARLEQKGAVNFGGAGVPNSWYEAGYTGTGVKVGIVGLFDTTVLATEVASGELAAPGGSYCVSNGVACPFGTPGSTLGNSIAEIVADAAPGASLYLAELGSRGDYYPIIDWMASQGVTIVVNPLVWTYDGPGNGTGPSAAVVDYAVSKGIAWFNTAAELGATADYATYNGGYWRGLWSDPDNDRWLNFYGSDETMSVYCGYLLGLRWSDWGAAPTDYDLFISDYRASTGTNGTAKILSAVVQGQPLEGTNGAALCNHNPAYGPVYDTNGDGFVSLWVLRKTSSPKAGTVGDVMELAVAYGWMERTTSSGGAAIAFADSANAGMATVGGDYAYPQMPTSSWGPTNDGRIKPNLVSRMCGATFVDNGPDWACHVGGYFGADASAATVAGYAAVAHQVFHFPSPKSLMLYMRDQAYNPYGPANRFGDGGVFFMDKPPPTSFAPSRYVPLATPQRVVDTRNGTGTGGAVGPLAADQTLRFTLPQPGYAVVLNVAVVNATAPGWLSVYPHGWSYPSATSALNADTGQTRANLVVVPSPQGGQIDVYSSGGGHVIVDYVGYYAQEQFDGSDSYAYYGSGRLHTLDPFRLVDTRNCVGLDPCSGSPRTGGTFLDVQLAGATEPGNPENAIPADAIAAAFTLTIDSPAAKGYASVLPGGQSQVLTSNLNFDAGGTSTTVVMTPLNEASGGVARIFSSVDAHVQVDLLGWFTEATGTADPGGMFVPVTPVRVLDTRQPPRTKPLAEEVVAVDLSGLHLPEFSAAVFINNVSVFAGAPGEVEVRDTAADPAHAIRNLSFTSSRPVAGGTISRIADETFTMRPSASTHLISDLAGYFLGAPAPAPAGSVIRVTSTTTPDNVLNNSHAATRLLDMSDDGEVVLFHSPATNLVGRSTNSGYFLWRRSLDTTVELPAGTSDAKVSADGSTVAFVSSAVLLPEDVDGSIGTVYTYDVGTGALEAHTHLNVPGGGSYWIVGFDISPDGSKLAWLAIAANQYQGYWKDLTTGTLHALPLGAWNHDVAFAGDGDSVLTLMFPGTHPINTTMQRITLATGAVESFNMPADVREFVSVSQDGRTATVLASNDVHLVSLATQSWTRLIVDPPFSVVPYFSGRLTADAMSALYASRVVWVCRLPYQDCSMVNRTWNGDMPNDGLFTSALMSPDGRYVAIMTRATNMLDENVGPGHVYLIDRAQL